MISGGIDPAAPYWFGQSAVKHLRNGRQLVVKNVGHAFGHPCLQKIAAEFIDKGSIEGLNTGCIETITRPPFVTQFPR